MRKSLSVFFIMLSLLQTSYAHVGSPGVVMEGNAGPYKILVNVIPPNAIPGIAKVTVYLQNGPVDFVSLRAVDFRLGDEGAPKGEPMEQVMGQNGQFKGEIWLMGIGSSSIQITVKGAGGKGDIVVPVVAISTQIKKMPATTGFLLAGLGIFLIVLLITIIGSSVSDALTKEGEIITERRKKIRWIGVGTAAILTSLIVFGGNMWWQRWARNYSKDMFKPVQAELQVKDVNSIKELHLSLDTNSQRSANYSFIIPDHGKMMHMFIMRIPAMDAFAHLHPFRIDSAHFRTILPKLPKGKYLVFADIVYNTGFTETIKDTFNIPVDLTDSLHKLDNDDAYAFALPADLIDKGEPADPENVIYCGKPGTGVKLKDGSTLIWEGMTNESFEAGKLYQLKFAVLTPEGAPAKLDSYLGMPGHAAIIRNDGDVYIHLHPVGTYSMAAERSLLKRIEDPRGVYKQPDPKSFRDSIDNYMKQLSSLNEKDRENMIMAQMNMPVMKGDSMNMNHSNMIEFPYSFPSPGQYRIWVQVKRNGQVLTGAFDKVVK